MSWQGFLTHKADIQRLEETVTEEGSVLQKWNTHLENIACLLEKDISQEEGNTIMRCYFPEATDIRPDLDYKAADRIVIAEIKYSVKRITRFNGMRLRLMVAELEQVQG